MINLNTNINMPQNSLNGITSSQSINNVGRAGVTETGTQQSQKADFSDALKIIDNYISDVDGLQQSSDVSIKDLLSSSNADITTVVADVAKADVSFKLLVGVRNQLIEAYKQTMNMQL